MIRNGNKSLLDPWIIAFQVLSSAIGGTFGCIGKGKGNLRNYRKNLGDEKKTSKSFFLVDCRNYLF